MEKTKTTAQLEKIIDLELLAQLKADLRNYKKQQTKNTQQVQSLQAA